MRIVVMCGGSETHLHDYSLPKPLNYIHAKPAITYVLENTSFKEIDFIVAPHLIAYQFESTIRLHFKHKICRFHYLPYSTRGPVESAWLGTIQFEKERDDEPIVFLDNDVVYKFPEYMLNKQTAFLGYSIDKSGSEAFSFLRMNRRQVLEIQEKKRISDMFVCGVYGFASLNQFREYAKPLLQTPQPKELYLSLVFSEMILKGVHVEGVECKEPILHIGSLQEVKNSLATLPVPKLRICVDLDNTLVTSPIKEWDYSTVQPIPKMIQLVQEWKKKGHTIIIHTARKMQTCKNNVGAATANCAKVTLETLERYEIPYDELLFGKPMADVYVDDKALNPYLNTPESFGFFEIPTEENPINALSSNKCNQIILEKGSVLKRGPTKYLAGEIYYHCHIPEDSAIRAFFPKLTGHSLGPFTSELRTEHIKGIPLAHLWQSKLLTHKHIDDLLENVRILHNTIGTEEKPTKEMLGYNYIQKTVEQFEQKEEYPFPYAKEVMHKCMSDLMHYVQSDDMNPVHFIHGDLEFRNILLTFQNTFQFIDMKGICWKTHTTGGDPLYDYAKLYQSFLGYDAVLNGTNDKIESEYTYTLRTYYETKLRSLDVNMDYVRTITFAMVLVSLPFIADKSIQEHVWCWAREVFMPRTPDD